MNPSPELVRHLRTALPSKGLAIFGGIRTADELATLAASVIAIVPHRDSAAHGVTTITHSRRGSVCPGFLGFSDRELLPHTDGSSLRCPPEILLMTCARQAATGGECILVDGLAVYQELALRCPDMLRSLSTPRSVLFGGTDGHLGAVFSVDGDSIQIRLRMDGLARFSPEVARCLYRLREVIDRHAMTFRLDEGQGYAIDNHRWLHARRAFTGDRTMYRVMGRVLPVMHMKPGFLRAQSWPDNL